MCSYLRRFLRLPDRSMKSILFSETGLLHRRIVIALRYLLYLVELPMHLPPHRALLGAIFLAQHRIPSWFSDLQNVLRRLEVPAVLPTMLPSRELVAQLVQQVHHSFWYTTHAKLTTSSKTRLLPH
jgi:hypothetical protein